MIVAEPCKEFRLDRGDLFHRHLHKQSVLRGKQQNDLLPERQRRAVGLPQQLHQPLPVFELVPRLVVKIAAEPGKNLHFPVLGKVHVADYTMRQISDNLKYDIISRGYIKDPIVNVRLTNFSVTVLGETGQTVLKIDEDSFNILQLIAKTGGTSDNAKIRDIMVIRKENGEERAYSVNLQSKDVFVSPVFYLQQNDIVYVKPRGIRFSNSGQTAMTFINTIVGIGTAFIYIMLWNTSK